jgi:low affinity Fe/Cu permease
MAKAKSVPSPTFFMRFARGTSQVAGRPVSFAVVSLVVLAWALSGPLFGFSEAWQLTINTLTTIVTFLMVFLIQHTQNRESEAIQLKLDELIVALDSAHNELLDSENLSEEEQLRLHRKYIALAERTRRGLAETHGRRVRPAQQDPDRRARRRAPASR